MPRLLSRFLLSSALLWACFATKTHADEAVVPKEPTKLFNGKDLAGWQRWLKATKGDDPNQVCKVTDGMIHLSGGDNGYIATEKAYRDYHLLVEFKWGKKPENAKYVRNSGILLHGTGEHGNAGGTWLASLECQLAQGCVGDLIAIRGKDKEGKVIPVTLTSDTVLGPDKKTRWKQGGTPTTYSGRQFWWSLHDPDFKELIDTRGKNDVESPLGEWTKVECICAAKKVTIKVNGTTVNEAYDVFPSAGKILLQTEGFEIFFRKVEIYPLP